MSESLRHDVDVDYCMLLMVLLHKLAPGQEVTITDADCDAAVSMFPGQATALRTLVTADPTEIRLSIIPRDRAVLENQLMDADESRPQ